MNGRGHEWGNKRSAGKIRERAGEHAKASCQYEGDAKTEKKKGVSQHGGAIMHRTKGEEAWSRLRGMCGGRGRRSAES